MTNFQVYRKTLSFSFVAFLVDMLAFAAVGGCAVAGFFIADRTPSSRALIGLVIGFVVGIILASLISFFIVNRIKAAQIAMMTKGVTENQLPDHTYKAGFQEVKGRFGKIALFFAVTNAIKGVFRQIGRGLTRLGTVVGGEVGGSVGSAIDSAVQTLLSYLCDCCLGWVLFRKDENSAKAACEGAVIFFKHGKTLIRNIGRIFGMGFLSFLLIGGAFFGLTYFICIQPSVSPLIATLTTEIQQAITSDGSAIPGFLETPFYVTLVICAFVAIVMWSMLHSVLIRPFILVGVLRNFMAAGLKEKPTEEDFKELDGMSPRFAKLHNSI